MSEVLRRRVDRGKRAALLSEDWGVMLSFDSASDAVALSVANPDMDFAYRELSRIEAEIATVLVIDSPDG